LIERTSPLRSMPPPVSHSLPFSETKKKLPRLVLHADDLGMNRAVTDGILRGFRDGLLTSTSLLANAPDASRALQQWKGLLAEQAAGRLASMPNRTRLHDPAHPFDLGVHLNLTQGRPLSGSSYPSELLDSSGRFLGVFALFSRLLRCDERLQTAIRFELERQVQVVCDHGLQPTHLNGHQYIEMMPSIASVVLDLLHRFNIKAVRVARECALWRSTVLRGQPLRWPLACVKRLFADRFRTRMDTLGVAHPDVFFGTAHAGDIDLDLMRRFLAIAQTERSAEIALHPGEAAEGESPQELADGWHDPLTAARPKELQMLVAQDLAGLLESAGWSLGRLTAAT
jgi:chitin disaccharide deacetylase